MTTLRLGAPQFVKSAAWWFAFIGGTALMVLAFGVNLVASDVHPRTAWGITYGVIAATLLLLAVVYAVRRRLPLRGPAPTYHWLQLHVYGGTLFLVSMFMHTAWRLPTGIVAWAMWTLSIWVVASGALGVLVQKWIPRTLSSGLTTEVHYDRIPELVEGIQARIDTVVRECDASITHVYESTVAPLVAKPEARWIYFVDITGGIQTRLHSLDHLKGLVSAAERANVDELRALVKTKLEMDAQLTLQRALRWWLFGHVPFTIALVVLVVVHLWSVLYY